MKKKLLKIGGLLLVVMLLLTGLTSCAEAELELTPEMKDFIEEQITGLQGPQGDVGATGPQGDVGATGPQGDVGATGPQGDVGATGPQGAKGDEGDPGEPGPAGIQGEQGSAGVSGPPGAAGYPPPPSYTVGLSTQGAATSVWRHASSNTGIWSVDLQSGTGAAGDEGRIVLTPVNPMTLSQFVSMSWSVYAVAGYPPHIDIIIDVDGDGVVDPEDRLTAEMAYNNAIPTTFIASILVPAINHNTGWLQTFELTTGDGFGTISDSTVIWFSILGGGPGDAPWDTLGNLKAGLLSNDPEGELAPGVVDGTAPIVMIELEIDNWILPSSAFVDDIVINGSPVNWVP